MKGLFCGLTLRSISNKAALQGCFIHICALDYPSIPQGSISQSIIFPNIKSTSCGAPSENSSIFNTERSECITKCGSCHNNNLLSNLNTRTATPQKSPALTTPFVGNTKQSVGTLFHPVGSYQTCVGTPFHPVASLAQVKRLLFNLG